MKSKNYFTHDYYAREDIKLQQILMEFGNEGYGVYWQLVEYLHEENGKIPNNIKLLSHKFRTSKECIEYIVSICFTIQDDFIISERIEKNLKFREQKRKEKSEQGRKAAQKRWGSNSKPNRSPMGNPLGNDAKEKEKDSLSKEREYKAHSSPSSLEDDGLNEEKEIKYNEIMEEFKI